MNAKGSIHHCLTPLSSKDVEGLGFLFILRTVLPINVGDACEPSPMPLKEIKYILLYVYGSKSVFHHAHKHYPLNMRC